MVFNLKEDLTLERLTLSRYGPGEFCEAWWDPEKEVPEWDGRLVRMSLEEDIAFTGGRLHWLAGRRKKLHLIG